MLKTCACARDLAGALLRRERESLEGAGGCGPLDEDRIGRASESLATTGELLYNERVISREGKTASAAEASCKLLDEELERRDGMMDNSRTRDGY